MQQPFDTYSAARPRLSEARPHTVHSLPSYLLDGGADEDYPVRQEDTHTPRASVAGRGAMPQPSNYVPPHLAHALSRDDTAADINSILYAPTTKVQPTQPATNENTAPSFTAHTAIGSFMNEDEVSSQQTARHDPFAAESSTGQPRQQQSLSRRLSRTTKEKFSDFKDTVNRRAPRMRRASTPQNTEGHAYAPSNNGHAPPLSPSKRVGRYADPRAKKFRAPWGTTGDRKDTPAPYNQKLAARPAPQSIWSTSGGDGARQSAAAYRYQTSNMQPWQTPKEAHEDLQQRRGRVGSLSSAADSGADLHSEYQDSVRDSEDDVDMDIEPVAREPLRIDFVTPSSYSLPREICLQVFEYLDTPELGRAEQTCKSWKNICGEQSVWRTAYLRNWGRRIHTDPAPILVGGAGVGRPNKPDQRWREMYKARVELERNWRRGAGPAGKAIYLSGHTDSVYCVQFDEEKIITGSRDRTIRVWDINTYQCIRVIGGPNVRPTLGPKILRTVDYPSFHLATASVNGTAYGDNIYHVPREWHDASILCLQYDEEILVTGSSDSDLLVWDIKTYQPIKRLKRHTGGVLDVALDGKHIISCSKDSRIIVWDRKTLEYRGELTGHRGPVNAVQLRGKYLVSASGDGIARMWDIEEMKLVKEFGQKERGLAAVEFAEDMKHVLAGGNDNITYKFEVATGREVMQYTGHSQLVRSLWLDSANKRVVSGSYDLDLRVYDFETGEEIWRAEEWTTSWMLAAKSDYRRIVATSQDGRVLVVDFGLKKGGFEDGDPQDGVDLLRGIENTNAIEWRRISWGGYFASPQNAAQWHISDLNHDEWQHKHDAASLNAHDFRRQHSQDIQEEHGLIANVKWRCDKALPAHSDIKAILTKMARDTVSVCIERKRYNESASGWNDQPKSTKSIGLFARWGNVWQILKGRANLDPLWDKAVAVAAEFDYEGGGEELISGSA
ncbi:hypothetical protein LTR15_003169 [Elasticomyces elasticus]|nr:hypothetical protein LTR15_003169 [Elasticomyces elasticus]